MDRVIIRLADPGGSFTSSEQDIDLSGTATAEVDKTDTIVALKRKGILVIMGPAPAKPIYKPTTVESFPPPALDQDMEPPTPNRKKNNNGPSTKKNTRMQT